MCYLHNESLGLGSRDVHRFHSPVPSRGDRRDGETGRNADRGPRLLGIDPRREGDRTIARQLLDRSRRLPSRCLYPADRSLRPERREHQGARLAGAESRRPCRRSSRAHGALRLHRDTFLSAPRCRAGRGRARALIGHLRFGCDGGCDEYHTAPRNEGGGAEGQNGDR